MVNRLSATIYRGWLCCVACIADKIQKQVRPLNLSILIAFLPVLMLAAIFVKPVQDLVVKLFEI